MDSDLAPSKPLSARLTQIVGLAQTGLGDKAIAAELGVSINTIKAHWRRLRERYQASNRAEVIARFLSEQFQSHGLDLIMANSALLKELERTQLREVELRQELARINAELERRAGETAQIIYSFELNQRLTRERIDYLEHLNSAMSQMRILVHDGEYGSSWRKHFMSDSSEAFGYPGNAWVDGTITVFGVAHSDDVPVAVRELEPALQDESKVNVSWRMRQADGTYRRMLDFNFLEPANATGIGNYRAISIDVTDWYVNLREHLNRMAEWPDLEV